MTKAGIGFIIAGVLVYFLASQAQIGWLYLFDAIIFLARNDSDFSEIEGKCDTLIRGVLLL